MHRRVHHHLSFGFIAAAATACAEQPVEPTEPESLEPRTHYGDFDENNYFRSTVWVADVNSSCSGTLVTPLWVLTAAHCDLSPPILVASGPAPAPMNAANPDLEWQLTVQTLPIPMGFDEDIGRDMALIRLPSPPPGLAPNDLVVSNPPLAAGACGNDFEATMVGHGTERINEPDPDEEPDFAAWSPPYVLPLVCDEMPGTNQFLRRFHTSDEWSRGSGSGSTEKFTHTFHGMAAGFCDWYRGSVGGDSGGSLFRTSDNLICGVVKGKERPITYVPPGIAIPHPDNPLFFVTDYLLVGNRVSATDSPAAVGFWAANLIDFSTGWWDGQCPPFGPDADGDGVVDSCDSCPSFYNPEQLDSLDDDADNDGLGLACDPDPACSHGTVNGGPNSNREHEEALFEREHESLFGFVPGKTAAGKYMLDLNSYPNAATLGVAEAMYRNMVQPDDCDPIPVPTGSAELTSIWDLPSWLPELSEETIEDCTKNYLESCGYVVQNTIDVRYKTEGGVPGATGDVGFRWCECANGGDSEAERAACAVDPIAGCTIGVDPVSTYAASEKWLPITTQLSPTVSETGATFQVAVDSGASGVEVEWDFRDLPGYTESETSGGVEGVLWTHTVALSDQPDGTSAYDVEERSNTYGSGRGFFEYRTERREMFVDRGPIFSEYLCPDCPWNLSVELLDVLSYPPYRYSLSGVSEMAPMQPDVNKLIRSAVDEGAVIVNRSEGLLDMTSTEHRVASLGLILNPKTGAPMYQMMFDGGSDGQAVPVALEAEPSAIWGEEVLSVFSGEEDVLFQMRSDGSVGRYSVARNVWSIDELAFPFEGSPIEAGAYSARDRAVWFVQSNEEGVHLGRWNAMVPRVADQRLQMVATLPGEIAEFETLQVQTSGTRIVVSASKDEVSRLVLFEVVEDAGVIEFVGAVNIEGAAMGRPILRPEGAMVLVKGEQSELRGIPWDEFSPESVDEEPWLHELML